MAHPRDSSGHRLLCLGWGILWLLSPSGAPASPRTRAGALIQTAGPPLRGGVITGGSRVALERAEGGETPILTFFSARGPVRLLLDTGAASALVTPRLVQRLGLSSQPLAPKAFAIAGGGRDCPTGTLARTRLPELGLPAAGDRFPLRLVGVEALVLPGAGLPFGVDGVLAAPSLRQVPVAIDPMAGEVALGPPALRWRRTMPSQPLVLPLRWRRGVPLLPLRVPSSSGGRMETVEALADTGAEGVFLTVPLAARLRPLQASQPARLVGVCGLQEVRRQRLQGLGLGTDAEPSQGVDAILLANPVFTLLGVEAIAGQDLLRHHRQLWRLDADPPRLELWPGTAGGEATEKPSPGQARAFPELPGRWRSGPTGGEDRRF